MCSEMMNEPMMEGSDDEFSDLDVDEDDIHNVVWTLFPLARTLPIHGTQGLPVELSHLLFTHVPLCKSRSWVDLPPLPLLPTMLSLNSQVYTFPPFPPLLITLQLLRDL